MSVVQAPHEMHEASTRSLIAVVAHFLYRTRAGLTLRAIGDNHGSAHALGLTVRRIRLLAVLFGGGCAGSLDAYSMARHSCPVVRLDFSVGLRPAP